MQRKGLLPEDDRGLMYVRSLRAVRVPFVYQPGKCGHGEQPSCQLRPVCKPQREASVVRAACVIVP